MSFAPQNSIEVKGNLIAVHEHQKIIQNKDILDMNQQSRALNHNYCFFFIRSQALDFICATERLLNVAYFSFILFISIEVGTATDLKKPANSLRSTEISSGVHLTRIPEENTSKYSHE